MNKITALIALGTFSIGAAAQTVDGGGVSLLSALLTLGVPTIILFVLIKSHKDRCDRLKMNYHWYISHVPLVNGKVKCRYCGSHRIQVRNGQNRSYVRTHYCGQCGEGLYYSAEDSWV